MDYVKIWSWLKSLPLWLRSVVLFLLASLALIASMSSFASCGTPKTIATVHNANPHSTVTVTMSVSNSNNTTPSVDTSVTPEL